VLGAVLIGVIALCVAVMRNTIVAYDDWNFVLDRRGGSPSLLPNGLDQWMQPHNGHPVMVLVGFYRAAGRLSSYNYPAMICVAAFVHASLVAAIFVYARRRVGSWGALVPAVLVALIGRGAYVVLSPIAMAFTLALLAGVLALNIIDSPGRRRPAVAAILGLFALCSSGLGVARVVTIATDRLPRSRTWRSFVVWSLATATPMAMLAIWYVNVRRDDRSSKDFGGGLTFALRLLGNGAVALFGIGDGRAVPAAAILAAAMGAILFVRRRSVDWYRIGALAVGLAVDLGLVTWARSGNTLPSTGRYLYVVGVQVALIGTECLRGWRPPIGRIHRLVIAASIAVVGGSALAGSQSFRTVARDFTRDNRLTQVVFASFLRAQANGVVFDDGFQPESHYAPQVSSGRFNGLLADDRNPLRGSGPAPRTEQEKQVADFFGGLERIRLVPSGSGSGPVTSAFDFSASAPVEVDSNNVLSETKGGCTTVRSIGVGAFVDLQVPIAGDTWLVSSSGSTLLQTRKLADGFSGRNAATVTPRRDALITVEDGSGERSRRAWVIRIEPSPEARVCTDTVATASRAAR
jgi:hypothetical protein